MANLYRHVDGAFPAGAPRVVGDEEENFDADDFDDEFQIKNHHDDVDGKPAVNHVVIALMIRQQNHE